MFDLIDYGVSSEKKQAYLPIYIEESDFTRDINIELSKNEFRDYYELSVESALGRINTILHFGRNKMIINNRMALMVSNNTLDPEISIKNVKSVDSDCIKLLSKRVIGNVDSALTQVRTILEETFDYVLEKRNIKPSTKGDINKLYRQVKDKMQEDENTDKRVNHLLSGLENIVYAVSEMCNKIVILMVFVKNGWQLINIMRD